MPKPILADAENFLFTSSAKETLELYGALLSWSDEIETGVVEKLVVKRPGALHQRVGAPPKRYVFRCAIQGANVRTRYQRIVEVLLQQPEGQLAHPRFGPSLPVVCKTVGASESPGNSSDVIEFTLSFSDTSLGDLSKPAPAASASKSAERTQAARDALKAQLLGASADQAADNLAARGAGFLQAMQNAEAGLGTLPDVDASLAALSTAVAAVDATPGVLKTVRSTAALSLSAALQARNQFMAGRPPLVDYVVKEAVSLGVLMQRLYGGRGREEKALTLRLNRIRRPFNVPTGTRLLLTDPRSVVLN